MVAVQLIIALFFLPVSKREDVVLELAILNVYID